MEIKSAPGFDWRETLIKILAPASFIALNVANWHYQIIEAGFIAFVISCAISLGITGAILITYRCPQCRHNMGLPRYRPVSDEGDNDLCYDCKHCNIRWRTFATAGNSSTEASDSDGGD
ncbi:MAG: hypothetical protein LBV12_02670 [Puniceicoccales bacterium]|jgi:hypothetical protein|nr:hypothetical protein [Puniceicoccales bacterium]